ncbi:hypothetical protein [Escherichia fergusonii]|nr:hypothetical protein [Escherichia fergusonii]
MPDAGCRMPDAGCRMPDAGCRMPDAAIFWSYATFLHVFPGVPNI